MQGYYSCENCNLVLEVVTTSRNPSTYLIKTKIDKCPQCNKDIEEIEPTDFTSCTPKLFTRLKRIYRYKHVGKRVIKMKVKFL